MSTPHLDAPRVHPDIRQRLSQLLAEASDDAKTSASLTLLAPPPEEEPGDAGPDAAIAPTEPAEDDPPSPEPPRTLLGGRHVWVLGGLGVVAVLAALLWSLAARAEPLPEPLATPAMVAPGTAAPPTPSASPSILVHVTGAVASPGVVRLPAGARVADAIAAAGNTTGKADPGRLNLAAPVADGSQVWVAQAGEDRPSSVDAPGPVGRGGTSLVNLNTASSQELETLSGVGPSTAEKIIAHREANGRFTRVEELLEVSGIGPRTLERLREHVTV